MNFLVITGNPKKDGLCHTITEEIQRGAADGGAETQLLHPQYEKCRCCGNGWGTCREKNVCSFGKKGFNEAQETVRKADRICIITPTYWGEMTEDLKCFLDKLRRCEIGQNGALSGKLVLLVACPGGTGNGMMSCLDQMDRFCRHTGAVIFDYIGVNRWNSDYKRKTAHAAAKAMAEGRNAGETV